MADEQPRKLWSVLSNAAVAGILGAFLTGIIMEYIERRQQQREAVHSLLDVWYSSHIGGHRDAISRWFTTPEGAALLEVPPSQYGAALQEAAGDDTTLRLSVLEIADVFRTLDMCTESGRCSKKETTAAFGPTGQGFHRLVGPLLRYYDCELGTKSEEPVVAVAFPKAVLAPDSLRCDQTWTQLSD